LASPSSLFQAAGSEVKASGLWPAGFVGSAMLGLLVVASAILELTMALGCCCGRGEGEMTYAAEERDQGSVGCCHLAGEGDEEGNEGCGSSLAAR